MTSIPEIAELLRSTEKMADAFVSSIQERVGPEATPEVIFHALSGLSPRSIDMTRAVTAVRAELSRSRRRSRRRPASRGVISATSDSPDSRNAHHRSVGSVGSQARRAKPKSVIERIGDALEKNWSRAEHEGFRPHRMSAAAFIKAVHRHTDPRDATRSRILKACNQLDKGDVLISPTGVADVIRREV